MNGFAILLSNLSILFVEQEKEDYIDLTCDNSLERKICSVNPTNFWNSLNDEYPTLRKNVTNQWLSLSLHVVFMRSRIFRNGCD